MSTLNNVTVKTGVAHSKERNWVIGDVITSRWTTFEGNPQLYMIGWSKDYGLFLISLHDSKELSIGDIVTVWDVYEETEQGAVIEDAYDLQQAVSHSYRLAKEVNINVKY